MAKPMLVTLPLMLLLLDYWPLSRFGTKRRALRAQHVVWEKLPLLALAIGSSVMTLIAQNRGHAVSSLDAIPLGMRISNAVVSYVGYVDKMLWPSGLAAFYPHPKESLSAMHIALSVVLLIGFSALIFRAARRKPYLAFGWLWYLIALLPVIGVIQVGFQSMADRYTYIPLVGLFIMAAWLVPDLVMGTKRWGERELAVPACLVIVVLALGTLIQTGYWHDNIALFSRAIRVTKGNFTSYLNLGVEYAAQGNFGEAVAQYNQALAIRPDWDMAYYNLGRALAKKGDSHGAIEAFEEALAINPNLTDARVNLATQLAMAGRTKEAVKETESAKVGSLDEARMHFSMGNALDQQQKFEEAIKEYQEAVRLQPTMGIAHNNLAVDYYYVRDYAAAWKEARLANDNGTAVNPEFLRALSEQMPDPGG